MGLRQGVGVRTWLAVGCGAPEADRSGDANGEERVKWHENRRPFRCVPIEVDPEPHSLKFDEVFLASEGDAAADWKR